MRDDLKQQLRELLSVQVRSSRELTSSLEISQPTLSRLVQSLRSEIVVLGKGRATRYGLPRPIHQQTSRFPVYAVDSRGDAHAYGTLTTLKGGSYWWEDVYGRQELFPRIPWFLVDQLLSGFTARGLARRLSETAPLSRRLSDWSAEDQLFVASRWGEDRAGHLLVGDESLARYLAMVREESPCIELDTETSLYPRLAQTTLAGDLHGSHLAGEQPKFTVCVNDQGVPCHMLIKFSPAMASQEARRYADLLICEHLALEALRTAGHSTARSRLLSSGQQVFLCLKRFDRRGLHGRLPTISLRAAQERLQAPCDNWIDASLRLESAGLISARDARKLRWMALFSDLIGNSNQHFGNISLIPHQRGRLIMAPLYGPRPTLYEPLSGEIPQRLFTPPPLRNEVADLLPEAHDAAVFFWKSAAVDERISPEFRQICFENCELLQLREHRPTTVPG